MKTKTLLAGLALVALTGCSSTVPSEYVKDVAYVNRTPWAENYQTVYRKVVKFSEACFQRGAISGFRVERDLFPDIQEGRVAIITEGLGSRPFILFVVDIKPTKAPNESEVAVYAQYEGWSKKATVWMSDLSKGKEGCV